MHRALLVLFVLSGAAALVYEVVWFHLLRLVVGASALSLGIVLSCFMGGMFLGSLAFSRVVRRGGSPLRVYAALEFGIGVFGLALPLLLPRAQALYFELFGYGPKGIALRAAIAALLLLPPTALMGATLPAVARLYAPSGADAPKLGALYAANTIGAVLGSVLSGFVLLPRIDVLSTSVISALVNFGVGAAALWLARRAPSAARELEPGPEPALPTPRGDSFVVYAVIAASGLTALGAQVVWTRLLSLLFGATVYTFTIILAVFLGGLGIGSAIGARLVARRVDSRVALALCQLGLVIAITTAGALIGEVIPYTAPAFVTPIGNLHTIHVVRTIEVILPAAMLWGASFPLALEAAGGSHADGGRASGNVYAANTAGAILGALGASLGTIPALGTRRTEQLLVVVAGAAACAMLLSLRPRAAPPRILGVRLFPGRAALVVGAFAFLFAWVLPGLPKAFKVHGRYAWYVSPRDRYPYVSEGATSTVGVHVSNKFHFFHVAGRVEASDDPSDLRLERLLGHLSALAPQRVESVLVVGLGAGITAGTFALYPNVRRIVICEIEPRVLPAARDFFGKHNYGVIGDPRVQVIFDDARHFMATTREKFDVITSDPIHPWVRGNSILFSREYYRLVARRLKPGGVATQWVPLYETSEEAIQIQMKTFMEAFPGGTVYNSRRGGRGYDVVLLGSAGPLQFDVAALQKRLDEHPAIARSLAEADIHSAVDLLGTYGTRAEDMREWLANTRVNRDFSLRLEYVSGLSLNSRSADVIYAAMTRARRFPEGLFRASPAELAELRARFDANVAAPR